MRRLNEEIQAAKGRLAVLTDERKATAYAARQKRLRIQARLKAHYGFDNAMLIRFGIAPREPVKRKRKAERGVVGAE